MNVKRPKPPTTELPWLGMRQAKTTPPPKPSGPTDLIPLQDLFKQLTRWKSLIEQHLEFIKGHQHDRIENEDGVGWLVNPEDGDLVPYGEDQGFGDATNQPRFLALRNDVGLRGGLVTSDEADGGMAVLLGLDETGIEGVRTSPQNFGTTRPVRIEGTGIYFAGLAGYAFKLPDGTDPADVEDHYAKFGTVFAGPGGAPYVTLEVGPSIPVGIREEFTDSNDYDLVESVPQIVVSGTLVNTFTTATRAAWEVLLANLGDRACDFRIQVLLNSAPVGPPSIVTLSGGEQFAVGNTLLGAPPSAGDVVALEVTAENFLHPTRPDPWVLGASDPSTIVVSQEAP